MIDPSLKLTTFHDDGGSFTDYSDQAVDYLTRPIALTVTSDDYIYLGYSKPFNATYFEMKTVNTNSSNLLVEYYDGSSWQTASYHDDSAALSRSGLISWDKSNMSQVEINSVSKYYVRISLDADSSAIEIHGANIIFSDDREMKQEFFEIDNSDLLPVGFDSHIPKHVAARNEIIQELRNRGNQKDKSSINKTQIDINPWDLHDIFQVRQAATYLALAKIFFNLSDDPEDHWFRKFEEYHKKYKSALSLFNLNYDEDNDGIEDETEQNNKYRTYRWAR